MRSSIALIALGLVGCSLGNRALTPCSSGAECREAFGFGSTCGDLGFCEGLDVPARCETTYPADLFIRPEDHADALVFGTLFDHNADLGNLQSVELAFDEANIGLGLDGREVALVHCDYQELTDYDNASRAEAVTSIIGFLADDVGVPGVVGPTGSQVVLDGWDAASSRSLFMISPSATSDELVTIDGETSTDEDPGLFWRTAPPDTDQAAAIVADLAERGVSTVAIIAQSGAYGDGLVDALRGPLGLPGDQVFTYANSNQLTAAIVDAGAVSGLEEVIFISSIRDDITGFLNGAATLAEYDAVDIFLTDTARNAEAFDVTPAAEDLIVRVRGTAPIADPGTANVQSTFYLAYSARYGTEASGDSYNAFSYDAAWLTLYGAAWANSQEGAIEGTSIARGLRKVSSGPTVQLRAADWTSAQASFADGSTVDVRGASGELDFDPTTGETTNPIAVWVKDPTGDGFLDEKLCYGETCSAFPQ